MSSRAFDEASLKRFLVAEYPIKESGRILVVLSLRWGSRLYQRSSGRFRT